MVRLPVLNARRIVSMISILFPKNEEEKLTLQNRIHQLKFFTKGFITPERDDDLYQVLNEKKSLVDSLLFQGKWILTLRFSIICSLIEYLYSLSTMSSQRKCSTFC